MLAIKPETFLKTQEINPLLKWLQKDYIKDSIKIVKEGKPYFFYTAHNVLLTPLPFKFYFPPWPPSPHSFYIFFHPHIHRPPSTLHRPHITTTISIVFPPRPPPPPPHFYCFPFTTTTTITTFLLFSLHHHHHRRLISIVSLLLLLLISIVFTRKGQRGQNQAITFEFRLLGVILAPLTFSRENNRNEEEEEEEEKQLKSEEEEEGNNRIYMQGKAPTRIIFNIVYYLCRT